MTFVAASLASRAMPCSMVAPPTASYTSRPPVPMAWLMPPPMRWICVLTSCKPVPEAATSPIEPERTALAKPKGTPPMMAVPQSGPITSRPRRVASRLSAASCARGTLSLNKKTLSPSLTALRASAAA